MDAFNEAGINGEENKNNAVTRRTFAKGLGLLPVGVALSGMFAGLTGCASGEQPTEKVSTEHVGNYPVTVHETDVVIVGGGLAGLTAARRIWTSGKRVIVVDKGPFGHSGASGQNWGGNMISGEWAEDGGKGLLEAIVYDFWGCVDQDWANAVVQATIEGHPSVMTEMMGITQQRNPDGTIYSTYGPNLPMSMTYGQRVRRVAQHIQRIGLPVYDRMMMIETLLDDSGKASGVAAIDLKTGDAHLFRAPAIIMATGSYSWALGRTLEGPDDTGDGHAVFLKNGIALQNMEFTTLDYTVIAPFTTTTEKRGVDCAGMFTLNSEVWTRGMTSEGKIYTEKFFNSDEYKANPATGFSYFITETMKQSMAGQDIYYDTVGLLGDKSLSYDHFTNFPVDIPWGIGYQIKDKELCGPCAINTTGSPYVDTNMATNIPGIYSIMQNLTYYGQLQAFGQGWISGKAAAEYANETEMPDVSWDKVNEIFGKAYGLLEREGSDTALRACTVIEDARQISREHLTYPRSAEGLNESLEAYEQIRTDIAPKMYCASKSRILNPDWRNALELDSVLLTSQATARASLLREESRPWFFRSDFPVNDNENWLKNIWITYKGDDQWENEITDINDSFISMDVLKSTLAPVDMSKPSE